MASKGWGKINKLRDKAKSKVQAVAGHSKELTLTPADTEVSYISIFFIYLFSLHYRLSFHSPSFILLVCLGEMTLACEPVSEAWFIFHSPAPSLSCQMERAAAVVNAI